MIDINLFFLVGGLHCVWRLIDPWIPPETKTREWKITKGALAAVFFILWWEFRP